MDCPNALSYANAAVHFHFLCNDVICLADSLTTRLLCLFWYSYLKQNIVFPDRFNEVLGLVPELFVDRQVDEEVAQVVDVVAKKHVVTFCKLIAVQRQWYESDDVDDGDEDELRHGNHVTSVGL